MPSGPLSAGGIIKNVSSLSGNFLNDLCYYVNKNLSVKPLSSTWITSVFITICSLEIVQFVANLAMITALKCSSVSHAFRCVVEQNKNVGPRSVRTVLGKTVPSETVPLTEYRPRCRSICQPTIDRAIYGRHSTAAVYQPIVDRYLVVAPPIYHRQNIDTPLTYHRLLSYP